MAATALFSRLREKLPDRQQLKRSWARGTAMFGKPDWFVEKKIGWGLTPITWQGWLYTLAWVGVIVVPFLMLTTRGLVPEGVIWMTASIGALVWDVRNILRTMHAGDSQSADNSSPVYYIGDDEDASHMATRNYDLRLRK
jgi:hypothetical protein